MQIQKKVSGLMIILKSYVIKAVLWIILATYILKPSGRLGIDFDSLIKIEIFCSMFINPCGATDNAFGYEPRDCRFESCHG